MPPTLTHSSELPPSAALCTFQEENNFLAPSTSVLFGMERNPFQGLGTGVATQRAECSLTHGKGKLYPDQAGKWYLFLDRGEMEVTI